MTAFATGVPPAGPHGGDGARLAAALGLAPGDVLDLSASLNPFAPDPAPIVARHLDALGRYPHPGEAERALAAAMDVSAERVVLTNGGAHAIEVVADLVGGGVDAEPEFSLHPRHPDGPRWRSDPHNPTGRLARPDECHAVRDEAFYPLATGRWSRGDDTAWVVGSLTKLLACPGLRLGYVLVPAGEDPAPVRARRGPWAVNGLAAAATADLLAGADLARWAVGVTRARVALVALLEAHGLAPQASEAPWVLLHAPTLRDALGAQGVAVRDCASFGLDGHVRIAVPDDAGLARLERALVPALEHG